MCNRPTAAVFPLYDPSRENGIPERPQTLRYSEIIKKLSADDAQSKRGAHSKSSHIKRLLHSALCSSLKYFTFTTDQMLNCTAQKAA